jgi:iron only hydrogenase large subunit-like protein/uncharacterized Fe-S cluster-containing protein
MPEYLKLKASNCKNCYKCIRHCPVKSIQFARNQANVIADECILCGHCFVACPQNAKEIRDDRAAAAGLFQSGLPVIASVAPSFRAYYHGLTISSLGEALKGLGFTGAEETALGATVVKRQYDAMVDRESSAVILSSCCHTVNVMVQKYYPEALAYLAPVVSPMLAHGMDIKRRLPEAKTVFVGPCISKKAEAEMYRGSIDCVLTFDELSSWLKEKNIPFPSIQDGREQGRARIFPTTGGIVRTMEKKNPRYAYLSVDGIENCMAAVEDVLKGNLDNCFIEMSACTGSCIGGPVMGKNRPALVRDYISVSAYAGKKDFEVFEYAGAALHKTMENLKVRHIRMGAKAIEDVLRQLGKIKPEDELNCGSCGYNTCREKAAAVLEGKATLTMCLPYLKEKAESFSDNIIKNTPNAIIVLNESFEVQQINGSACRLMNISSPQNILGDQVVRILDPLPFIDAGQKAQNQYNKRVFLADYEKYVDQTIIYDKDYHIIICIMRDVTEETLRREDKEVFNRNAMEITDRVIEKQMRTVQEIASLLGETTAETKIALTKLKESLIDDTNSAN